MNTQTGVLGYRPRNSFFENFNPISKLLLFVLISAISMFSFDVRYLFVLAVLSTVALLFSRIRYREYKTIVILVAIFALINLGMYIVIDPGFGTKIFGTTHNILKIGYLQVTQELLFYELALVLKYFITVPLAIIFFFTTNPNQFAASLNKIGVPYKIAFSVSLALRYIPELQLNYRNSRNVQMAKGYFSINEKQNLKKRIQGEIHVIWPLMINSFNKIEQVSYAMELRRFGIKKRRTWFVHKKLTSRDYLLIALVVAITLLGIGLFIYNHGRYWNPFK
ncbi:MAG: energy-coupling factor transporter transmembrane protein EcfT [Lactobacillaceae bacterium]|jgi:energy-coupling factor transport system permease protein|nr:energy-coupling factor transporter transmembrane protein EcfT [Lactobacillaceae bacterium]